MESSMDDDDLRSKNKSGWASGRVAFVPLSVAELYDSRLSAEDKVLLLMLRYRSGRNGYTYISWETLSKESGTPRSTLMRSLKRLRDLGFLQTEARGFSKTSDKLITDPNELYPDDLMDTHTVGQFFKANRTESMIRVLRSVDLKPPGHVDNSDTSSSPENETSSEPVHVSHQRDISSPKNETSDVPPVGPKLAKGELAKGELDSTRFARDAGKVSEETTEDPKRVVLPTYFSGRETRPALRDEDLRRPEDVLVQAQARAAQKALEAQGKRQDKKAHDDKFGLAAERARLREEARLANKTAGGRFYDWAKVEYERFFPTVRMTKWMKTEFSQLKILLDACHNDEELIRKAWSYVCENWDELTKKLKIGDAAPTIGVLLAMRARIIPLVQDRKSERAEIERKPVGTKIGEW